MLKSFFWNRKWLLWAYGGGLFLLISLLAQVYMSVLINDWYRGFYDLFQNATSYVNNPSEGIALLKQGLLKFFCIAIPYVLLATLTSYFAKLYAFEWREAITFEYIPLWQKIDRDIEGSSQRIQEDCYRFSRILETLGLQVVRAIMTLIAFLPILWTLSAGVDLPYIRDIPGSLVWLALFVSSLGVIIAWWVGYHLPKLEYNNQVVEAAFRKELVHGEDNKKEYCKTETIVELFTGLKFNYRKLFLHTTYLGLYINMFDQFVIVLPFIFVGPGLFTVSNAFEKVQNGFSLFLHNWDTITELRSIVWRLKEFEKNIGFIKRD